jgi:6-phosphogluconolactonase (cycloisomerase 2 family)
MIRKRVPVSFLFLSVPGICLLSCLSAFAGNPIVHVSSPANNSQTTSPVNYVVSATSPDCAQGIQAIRIYSAPYVSAFTGGGAKIDTYVNLPPGTYNTVVQAWDNCGKVGEANVTVTTTGEIPPEGFLYTVNSDGDTTNNVQGFGIVASNGALAPTGQAPVNANQFPVSAAADKGGYRLYVGDYISGDIFAYFIDSRNGYLIPVPGSPYPVKRSVTAVAVHPSGQFVFAARSEYAAGDGVAVFQVQSDGTLKEAPGSPYSTQTGPQALVVDPGGNYLYVADGSGFIDIFQIDRVSGALAPMSGSPWAMNDDTCGGAYPVDLLDLSGTHLYAADGVTSVLDGYSVEPNTGNLVQISGSPWQDTGGCQGIGGIDNPAAAYAPKALAVDGTGKFLYALNEVPFDNIAIYAIGANGALTYLTSTATYTACWGSVRTDPGGNYLYTGSCNLGQPPNFGALEGYAINHATGGLTRLPTSPFTFPLPGRAFIQDIAVTPWPKNSAR